MPFVLKFMKIHFVGIGGIGVSALAKYYIEKGHQVTGSDLVSSEITQALKNMGADIRTSCHTAKNLPKGVELVIYSPAVSLGNPELLQAKKRKIKVKSYPKALGELTKQHFTIAVSGTHGKSTTTAMLGLLLIKAGLDPTVIIGTKMKEFGNSNCRTGKSQYLIIEADEHFASFLNYWPKIIVLTTVEADHLDYYKNLNNIIKTFRKYILHLPEDGFLVANKNDKNTIKILNYYKRKVQKYSLKQSDAKKLRKILKIPGDHNILNALAALNAARILKIPDDVSLKALAGYKGAWRRFDERETKIGESTIKLINDYGHHPTEILATLKATREKYPKKKICCVFQPHQYQRTFYLLNDFIKSFRQISDKNLADKLIITDIYDVAGREDKTIKQKINSEKLVEKTKRNNISYLPKNKIMPWIKQNISEIEVLIVMGAGDIYNLNSLLR